MKPCCEESLNGWIADRVMSRRDSDKWRRCESGEVPDGFSRVCFCECGEMLFGKPINPKVPAIEAAIERWEMLMCA